MNTPAYLALLDVEAAVRIAKDALSDGSDDEAAAYLRTLRRRVADVERHLAGTHPDGNRTTRV